MRHGRAARAILAAFALLAGAAPLAQSRDYAIDALRSEVRFSFAAPGHTITGRTRAIAGSATLAPDAASVVNGIARVQAASLDTGNGFRDRKMRSMLEAKEHPEIVFKATAFTPSGARGAVWRGALAGDLTLRGVTRPVVFEVQGQWKGGELHAHGASQVRFTDFGMKPPRGVLPFMRAKDEIALAFDVVAVPAPRGP